MRFLLPLFAVFLALTARAQMRPEWTIVGGVGFWDDFRLVDNGDQKASYPGIAKDFARTFRVLQSLACDLFLGGHGSYFGLKRKLPRLEKEGPQVFLDPSGYKDFAAKGKTAFEMALKKEQEAARR